MYYPNPQKIVGTAKRKFAALLVFTISFFTFQSDAFAGAKAKNQSQGSSAEELLELGFIEQETGNLDVALAYYLQALIANPNQAKVLNDIGIIYEQMGVIDRAEEQYLDSLKVDPKYLPPLMNLAFLYDRKGDTAQAIEYLQRRIDSGRAEDVWTLKAREKLNEIYQRFPDIKQRKVNEQKADLVTELKEKARQKDVAELQANLAKTNAYYEKGLKLNQ